MNVSSYLKVKLDAERKIADALTKGVREVPGTSRKTLDDIYHGAERASWYSSCFFDKYQDVCKELGKEDVRMFIAIQQLYKRKDVILDIFTAYVKHVLKDDSGEPPERKFARDGANIVSTMVTANVTKMVLAYTLAKGLSESISLSLSVRTFANDKAVWLLNGLQYYGKIQKAAMAARRLRIIDPAFYFILYHMKIEMLYLFIEPVLSKIIKDIKSISNPTNEQIINILEGVK